MRRPFFTAMALFVISTANLRAEPPASPLGLAPKDTEFLLHIVEPKKALDAVYNHELFAELRKLQVAQDYYDATNVRRFFQLLSHFEKELGHDRMELLDKLTGGGMVLAARASEPAGGTLIIKAKDAELLKRFFTLARTILDQELARQEGKGLLKERDYHGIKTLQLDKFNVAISGAYLIGATDRKAFEKSLDLCREGKGDSILDNPRFQEASKERSPSALAWGWMDWQEIKKIPQVKTGIEQIGGDPLTFLLFGGVADVVKRSPWIAAALTEEKQNFRFSLTMPRGREGMPAIGAAIVPPGDKASLPLLKPPRTITSTSYYLDVAHFWDNKTKFLSKDDLKELEKGEKFIAPFLGGKTLGEVFKKLGPYQRLVSTQALMSASPGKVSLTGTSFALVLDLRDPTFGKNLDKILRAGGLAATFQFGLRMKEEEYKGYKLVAYYVNEKSKATNDSLKGLSPCFAQVGNQFMVSSTVELGRDLIDILDKEDRTALHSASTRAQLYAAGLADNIKSVEDLLVTQMVLNQGLSIPTARQEMKTLVELVRRFGEGEASIHYGRNNFRLDAAWRFKN